MNKIITGMVCAVLLGLQANAQKLAGRYKIDTLMFANNAHHWYDINLVQSANSAHSHQSILQEQHFFCDFKTATMQPQRDLPFQPK